MSSGYEEISFGGGDPDKEPRLQAWVRAHAGLVRLLSVCAVVLLVLGAAGIGGRYLYERSFEPLPPPEAALPEQLRFVVFLCEGYGPGGGGRCPGRRKATDAEGRAVAERMRTMPELAGVVFVSGEQNRRETLAYYADLGEEPSGEVDPFPTVRAVLRRSGDFAAVARQVRAMPAVDRVERDPADFWWGRADLAVVLCGTDDWSRYACPENRPAGVTGAVSAAERQAVLDRIWTLPEAETVYLQDREHHTRLMRHYYPEEPAGGRMFRIDLSRETFYVKLSDPAAFPAAAKALKSLPGVSAVYRVESRQ
ncbi:permease-like cell division protein FtsX [Planomonospora parontospora]|uniref:permease-like cell division protein FtsX n=1 Tax=Planomonospora parontospora TaxID=58119 RepID=UPI0016700B7B|nr:permease-like cell division protein FtsX [Planomonospora parontospora]GGL09289.1 hypothetical protein GCM10014719_09220 [Planomonospora parontospora subsp. antibiotica]GII14424.1 hypothetical protein Ppa05_11500 [Planomonospora parontospora subsp. antibiotica]